jgi:hypothetical protein
VSTHRPGEETNNPLIADQRDFYRIDKWMKDGSKVDHMLYAGSNLDKARARASFASTPALSGLRLR